MAMMKCALGFLMAVLVVVGLMPVGALASEKNKLETNAPVINSVTLDITDESELAEVYVTFDKPQEGKGDNNYRTVHLTKGEDGLYRGVVATDETMPCGTYTMLWCVAEDVPGNKTQTGEDVALDFELNTVFITKQPESMETPIGGKVKVSVEAQGEGLRYQWYVKENGAKTFKLSGNKTSAYAYTMQKYMNGRSVYCVITDRYGNTVQTNPVTIHIEK